MSEDDVVTVIEVTTSCSHCGKRIKYFCRESKGKIRKHHWMEEN